MLGIYITHFHPYLSMRNWLELHDLDKIHTIRMGVDPLESIFYIIHDGIRVGEYPVVLSDTRQPYLELKKVDESSFELRLPLGETVHLVGKLDVTSLCASRWLDILVFQDGSRTPLDIPQVNSITGESIGQSICDILEEADSQDDEVSPLSPSKESPIEIPDVVESHPSNSSDSGSEPTSDIEGDLPDYQTERYGYERKTPTESSLGPIGEYPGNRFPTRHRVLSFCTTCMRRLWQIQQTLGQNLHDNRELAHCIEFVVIDFGTEGLSEWVYKHFEWALETGYLRYLRTDRLRHWHASIAKNTSHCYARGDILVNLDCDNFTGRQGAQHILRVFRRFGKDSLYHLWSGVPKDGTYGRLVMHRDTWHALGGYDESFLPMGYQDHDLAMRYRLRYGQLRLLTCDKVGSRRLEASSIRNLFCQAIANDKGKSMKNTAYHRKMPWATMNRINRQKSHWNLVYRRTRVNHEHPYLGLRIFSED